MMWYVLAIVGAAAVAVGLASALDANGLETAAMGYGLGWLFSMVASIRRELERL
jgi:hypothetical protein